MTNSYQLFTKFAHDLQIPL